MARWDIFGMDPLPPGGMSGQAVRPAAAADYDGEAVWGSCAA